MIQFSLICENHHGFNGWFKNSDAFDRQHQAGAIVCPTCGNTAVTKSLQTPHIANNAGKNRTKTEGKKIALPPVQSSNASAPVPVPKPKQPTLDAASASEVLSPKAAEAFQKLYMMAKEVRKTVEKNCDDVGTEFAEEARKIHYGEADERGIYGQVTPQDAEDLIDEGIAIAPLPDLPKADS